MDSLTAQLDEASLAGVALVSSSSITTMNDERANYAQLLESAGKRVAQLRAELEHDGTRVLGEVEEVVPSGGIFKSLYSTFRKVKADLTSRADIAITQLTGYTKLITLDSDLAIRMAQNICLDIRSHVDVLRCEIITKGIVNQVFISATSNEALQKAFVEMDTNVAASKIMTYRKTLPIYARREEFIALFKQSDFVVLVGETGSGKTTQVPQFLIEEGFGRYGMIACTQPRRLAASKVSARVCKEFGVRMGDKVGYHIRHDNMTTRNTVLAFVTNGIMLRQIAADPLLLKYSVVIVDEAHERTVEIDLVLSLLKNAVITRKESHPQHPLKVVIMSASMDEYKFQDYIKNQYHPWMTKLSCPIFKVEGRMFPVEVHWGSQESLTKHSLVKAAVYKVIEIHEKAGMDSGDILVFMAGKGDIDSAIKMLRAWLKHNHGGLRLRPHPLHSKVSVYHETNAIAPAAVGERKVVFATNIAETSVTIDGVVWVVDAGLSKIAGFDHVDNVNTLSLRPISKAAAMQREGRAGRTQAGHCHRLYSADFFGAMDAVTEPDILRIDLCHIVIQLRVLGFDPERFDFIDQLDLEKLGFANKQLESLGAIDEANAITAYGHRMASIPILHPRDSRTLIAAADKGLIDEVLSIQSLQNFSVGLFLEDEEGDATFLDPEAKVIYLEALHRLRHQQNEFVLSKKLVWDEHCVGDSIFYRNLFIAYVVFWFESLKAVEKDIAEAKPNVRDVLKNILEAQFVQQINDWCSDHGVKSDKLGEAWAHFVDMAITLDGEGFYLGVFHGVGPLAIAHSFLLERKRTKETPMWICMNENCSQRNAVGRPFCFCGQNRIAQQERARKLYTDRMEHPDDRYVVLREVLLVGNFSDCARLSLADGGKKGAMYKQLKSGVEVRLDLQSILNMAPLPEYIFFSNAMSVDGFCIARNCVAVEPKMMLSIGEGEIFKDELGLVVPTEFECREVVVSRQIFLHMTRKEFQSEFLQPARDVVGTVRIETHYDLFRFIIFAVSAEAAESSVSLLLECSVDLDVVSVKIPWPLNPPLLEYFLCGKGMANIKKLRVEYQCGLHYSSQGSKQDIVIIDGERANVKRLKKHLLSFMPYPNPHCSLYDRMIATGHVHDFAILEVPTKKVRQLSDVHRDLASEFTIEIQGLGSKLKKLGGAPTTPIAVLGLNESADVEGAIDCIVRFIGGGH